MTEIKNGTLRFSGNYEPTLGLDIEIYVDRKWYLLVWMYSDDTYNSPCFRLKDNMVGIPNGNDTYEKYKAYDAVFECKKEITIEEIVDLIQEKVNGD